MGRKYRPDLVEKEVRMKAAIAVLKKNRKLNIKQVAEQYNVPRTTLNHRVNGRLSQLESLVPEQALTPAEEEELVRWISKLTITGFAPRSSLVKEMAESIRQLRTRRVDNETGNLVHLRPLGKNWLKTFFNRHPQCISVTAKPIERARIEGTTPEILEKWFNAYRREVIEDPNVHQSNVYNMDESGFSIGMIKAGKVIIDKQLRMNYQAQPGRQEWVTVIECICVDGTSVSPYVIFKGKDINTKWIPDNVPHTWRIGVGENGWTSQKHAKEWFQEVFEPETRSKAGTILISEPNVS
jgi:hypothetical protein